MEDREGGRLWIEASNNGHAAQGTSSSGAKWASDKKYESTALVGGGSWAMEKSAEDESASEDSSAEGRSG